MTLPQKFRKKPVTIEAMRYDGTPETATPIINWALSQGETITYWCGNGENCRDSTHVLHISTLEGTMAANVGDWIIRGVQGEFYPCRSDIFDATYEVAS